MEEKSIRTFTGLSAPDYWNLLDRLIDAGMRAGKSKLSLPSQVLLYLMKLRKGQSRHIIHLFSRPNSPGAGLNFEFSLTTGVPRPLI